MYNLFIKFSKHYSRKNLYKYLVSATNKHCRVDQNIINIGAGGPIKNVLDQKKIKFKEIDIDAKRKPDFICDAENMEIFKANSVDIFFCMEVLEHIKNPINAVKEMERVLKPGGTIIGSVPFVFPIHDEPHDYYRFTFYGIKLLFKNLKCLELKERNSYFESIFVIMVRLINTGSRKQRIKGILLTPFYLFMLPFISLFSLLVSNKQSTTGYFFVYQKR